MSQERSGPRHRAGPIEWDWTTTRLAVAAVLMSALIIVVGVGTFTPGMRTCADVAEQMCRPLAWSDPVVGLVFVFALLIGFPDISYVKVGPEGAEAHRDPALLSPNADLERRLKELEDGKMPEWRRETDPGGGQS